MTKVYLVCSQSCFKHGTLDINSKKNVLEVFTNKKLADKCQEWFNQEWYNAMQRDANYEKEGIKFYYVETRCICHEDYSKMKF